ncbi:MAG: DegT/DnrJ/EryC1/StrS family aminotransferase [candidate division Zixibacteria bacterium]|nr:DegT/DnrJ/EryC1/StrS family aminotransferase [candidate division Zixibacteria bacterium]
MSNTATNTSSKTTGVPLLDLKRQYLTIKEDLDRAVLNVLDHGKFILGPEVAELEKQIAEYTGCEFACGVNSGTDALLLSLRASGVGSGDEVITTDFSFFATAGVIWRLGAKPVLVDIEPDTFNIDPNLIAAAITSKTKAIIPVHLFGQMADMEPIMKIAQERNLKVVEDGAQTIGSTYKDKKCGSMGNFGCFSFFPSKNLGCLGDGGIIVCSDEEDAAMLKILRVHGSKPKYYHRLVGYNSRLATIQAASILVKLPHLRKWSETRIANAKYYDNRFAESSVKSPLVKDYTTFHIYNQYTVMVENRDEVRDKLKERGIGCEIYYPVPFHNQECFEYLGHKKDEFPNTNKTCASVLSIPIFPELTEAEREVVANIVLEICG